MASQKNNDRATQDKQQTRDFTEVSRTEVVDTLLREEMRALHGRYEGMNGLPRNMAKIKKANENKDRLVKEAESSHKATEVEFGHQRDRVVALA
ncbi:hypothetical protein CRG98_015994 [Punica granatum]|uniref:Uncharacterized protein n=1 Tax=Punica granatum TaxID=22663 RepID=A0A2I0K4Z2_PUNGR|nr:hypothetical protein CRG98_015994 [Punica granatum]